MNDATDSNNPRRARTDGSLCAGVAKRDISTDEPGIVVHDRLYAKALALSDGRTTLVIVSMDAVAIGGICDVGDDFLPSLRDRVENELDIPGGHVLVHATHTHPPGRILCDDDQQVTRTLDAIREALGNMVPVKAGAGRGSEDRIIINRNVRLKGGGHWTIRHTNPSPPDDVVESVAPIDPEIGVLRLDRADGGPMALLYNYACHPLIGVSGSHVTANYPGFASAVIEQALGHDAMALFLQGAAGDVIELHFKDTHRPRDSKPIGETLGHSTLAALKDIHTADATLDIITETVQLPRRTDSEQRIAAWREKQAELLATLRFTSLNFKGFLPLYLKYALNPDHPSDYSYRYLQEEQIGSNDLIELDKFNRRDIDKYLANIRAMEQLARIEDEIETFKRHQKINQESGEATVAAEIMGIRIGDCAIISAPIELLTEVGLALKAASPFEHTMIAAFSNGYLHYGPPVADYDKGGYEVIECLLDPGWRDIYENKAREILERLAADRVTHPTAPSPD